MTEPDDDEVTPEIEAAIQQLIRDEFERRKKAPNSQAAPRRAVRSGDVQPLLIPVPPMIEEALGYTGSSRFVAFFCRPDPIGFSWCDSHESRPSAYENVWQAFVRHRRVHPFVERLNLGNGQSNAEQWLLLDRVKRLFLFGNAAKVVAFLRSVPHEILSAEADGSDSAHLSVIQKAMADLVAGWLDDEDS